MAGSSGTDETQEKHQLAALLDGMAEGLAICEAVAGDDGRPCDARLLSVNRALLDLLAPDSADPVNRLASEVFGPSIRPSLLRFLSVLETGKPLRLEINLGPADRHCLVSVTPLGPDRFAAVFFDITGRHRAAMDLENERAFSNALIDSIPGILYVYDSELRLIRWNKWHEVLTGFTAEEMYHKSAWDWFDGPDRLTIERSQANIREQGVNIVRANLICKSGERRPFLLTAVRSPIGGEFYFMGVGIDLTELERAQTAQAALEQQLSEAQKLESIGRLAGGVAHDFNNLLTVINGYAAVLKAGLPASHSLRDCAEEIAGAGARAATLTRQLLAFSRRQIIEPRPLDLNAVIGEAESMLRRLVGEDIEISTVLDPALGKVVADPSQMHQVLMNLAANARDAMPDGGRLRIQTANVEGADFGGPVVCLKVSDTGVGMTEEVRQNIFEPFFTTKEKGQGTGLGLATVYGIVRQSGGSIRVDSAPGHGTTFRICLPRAEDTGEAAGPAAPPLPAGGTETILVVEDQEAVRRLAVRILISAGYRVLAAANGEEGVETAGAHPDTIHLLLTDVVLPNINGRQVAERVRAGTRKPGCCICPATPKT